MFDYVEDPTTRPQLHPRSTRDALHPTIERETPLMNSVYQRDEKMEKQVGESFMSLTKTCLSLLRL